MGNWKTRMEMGTKTEGTPKTEVKMLEWAAHHSTIILCRVARPHESSDYTRLSRNSCPSKTN